MPVTQDMYLVTYCYVFSVVRRVGERKRKTSLGDILELNDLVLGLRELFIACLATPGHRTMRCSVDNECF